MAKKTTHGVFPTYSFPIDVDWGDEPEVDEESLYMLAIEDPEAYKELMEKRKPQGPVDLSNIPPPTPEQMGITPETDEFGNPIIGGTRRSPNVRSQQTGDLVELPEGVNKFEYTSKGPVPPSRGYFSDEAPDYETVDDLNKMLTQVEAREQGLLDEPETAQATKPQFPTREQVRQDFFKEFGNPFQQNPYRQAKAQLMKDTPQLFNRFWKGAIPWGGSMTETQKKEWDKFYDAASKAYDNQYIKQAEMLKDAYADVMGAHEKAKQEYYKEEEREQKRQEKLNEMKIFEQKERLKRKIEIEEKERAAERARKLSAAGVETGEPLNATQRRLLAGEVRQAEQDLLQFPNEIWVRPNIKFINEHSPNRTNIWVWADGEAIEVPLRLPDGTPFTIADFLRTKENPKYKGLSDFDILKSWELIK